MIISYYEFCGTLRLLYWEKFPNCSISFTFDINTDESFFEIRNERFRKRFFMDLYNIVYRADCGYKPTKEELDYIHSLTKQQLVSELAKASLEHKWYPESNKNIRNTCPFCYYTFSVSIVHCEDCVIPEHICRHGGCGGIISKFKSYTTVSDIPTQELTEIIDAFKALII